MPVNIDPQFSVFRLVERIQQEKVSAVLNHRRTMSLISFQIEDATLVDGARTRVFAGFQRLSRFLPQVERYRKLAQNAQAVYVFGIPDVTPPEIPNVTYIPLSHSDQLANEWFLVSYGREYVSALATEELTTMDDPDSARMFKGIWTFDLRLVAILEEWLTHTVDAPALLLTEGDHDHQNHAKRVQNILNRLVLKVMVDMNPNQSAIIQGELKSIIKDTIYPVIADSLRSVRQKNQRQEEAVILFTDLRDFSRIAEKMEPRKLVEQVINPYLSTVSRVVYEHGGKVDKFLGDGVLAVFTQAPSGADRAMRAAQAILEAWSQNTQNDAPAVGIGLAQGMVHVGEIGSDQRHEDTVIGDPVNIAQHLSRMGYNNVWLSNTVYDHLTQRDQLESQGVVHLKGKSEPIAAYRFNAHSGS